jgi:hypothetical protein
MESDGNSPYIVSDRVSFKIYCAQRHLDNIKSIESSYRISSEMTAEIEAELDCLFCQITSAIDALLVLINDRFGFGIPVEQVNIDRVQSELNSKTKKFDLLVELHAAREYGSWLWHVINMQNQALRLPLMPQIEALSLDVKSSQSDSSNSRYERTITYLETVVDRAKSLVWEIRKKDRLLLQRA